MRHYAPLFVLSLLLVGAGCASAPEPTAKTPGPLENDFVVGSQAPRQPAAVPALGTVGPDSGSTGKTAPSRAPAAPAPAPKAPESIEKSVAIANFAFAPATLTVNVGSIIVWTNSDTVVHTVTANDVTYDSGSIAPGKTFRRTFSKAGTYSYHCAFHPSMQGTIIVK